MAFSLPIERRRLQILNNGQNLPYDETPVGSSSRIFCRGLRQSGKPDGVGSVGQGRLVFRRESGVQLSIGHHLLEHLGPAGGAFGNSAGKINPGSPKILHFTGTRSPLGFGSA
jgi:hypothetical protein